MGRKEVSELSPEAANRYYILYLFGQEFWYASLLGKGQEKVREFWSEAGCNHVFNNAALTYWV